MHSRDWACVELATCTRAVVVTYTYLVRRLASLRFAVVVCPSCAILAIHQLTLRRPWLFVLKPPPHPTKHLVVGNPIQGGSCSQTEGCCDAHHIGQPYPRILQEERGWLPCSPHPPLQLRKHQRTRQRIHVRHSRHHEASSFQGRQGPN